MISYRAQLAKIGVQPGTPISYRGFYSRPTSLRQAMRAMDMPAEFHQATEKSLDKDWTEECQGVIWDGAHWIFSTDGSKDAGGLLVGGSPKALYTFNGNTNFNNPDQVFVIAEVHPFKAAGTVEAKIPTPSFPWIHHVGPMVYHNGLVYVDHWNSLGGQLIVFQNNNGSLSYVKWIHLESAGGERVGMVGINPWDDRIYTSLGGTLIDRLFIHGMDGKRVGEMPLTPPINDGAFVQGGVFSPNGHLYISSGRKKIGRKNQFIYCYSALNGRLLRTIPVLAQESSQELEGICYADVTRNGQRAQLHAVLLDNIALAKDNIFFKSFAASEPDLV